MPQTISYFLVTISIVSFLSFFFFLFFFLLVFTINSLPFRLYSYPHLNLQMSKSNVQYNKDGVLHTDNVQLGAPMPILYYKLFCRDHLHKL